MKRIIMLVLLPLTVLALPIDGYGQDDTLTIATFNCEFLTRTKVIGDGYISLFLRVHQAVS